MFMVQVHLTVGVRCGNMWFTGTGVDPNSLSLGEQSGDLLLQ